MHLDQNEQERTDVTDAVRLEKVTCKSVVFFSKKFEKNVDYWCPIRYNKDS